MEDDDSSSFDSNPPDSDSEDSEDEALGETVTALLAQLKADLSEHPAFRRVLSYQTAICSSLLRHLPSRLVIPEVRSSPTSPR